MIHTLRRLPGIVFEQQTPALDETLPRMDIAVFVGFASSGPLHVPVVVEDAKQYAQIFGDDPLLAWDAEACEMVRAHLGSAVRAFFANGGRRCWVVRVADLTAAHNYFPLPGVLRCRLDRSGRRSVEQQPAFARARSQGSWSDPLQVRAAVRALAVPFPHYDHAHLQLTVAIGAGPRLQTGDLVRLRFVASGAVRYWLYARVRSALPPAPAAVGTACYQLSAASWFAAEPPYVSLPGEVHVEVRGYTAADGVPEPSSGTGADAYAEPPATVTAVSYHGRLSLRGGGQAELTLSGDPPCATLVQPGALLFLDVADQQAWLVVRRCQVRQNSVGSASPPAGTSCVQVIEGSTYWLPKPSDSKFDPGPCQVVAEVVTLDLKVRDDYGRDHELRDIGLAEWHARGWSGMNGDRRRYRPQPRVPVSRLDDEARAASFPLASVPLQVESLPAASPPVSDNNEIEEIYIPLGLGSAPSEPIRAVTQPGEPLHRDGLEKYDAALFLDDGLATQSTTSLMAEADHLRYFAARPRPLCGVHAVLGFEESRIGEEATLIAVPDAVHRRWEKIKHPDVNPVVSIPAAGSGAAKPDKDDFQPCAVPTLTPPLLETAAAPTSSGRFTLVWTGDPDCDFHLEEAATLGFESTTSLYTGRGRRIELYRPAGGRHLFRVRALKAGQASGWSNTLDIRLAPVIAYHVKPLADYQTRDLNDVHCALLRLSAAHGELFTVLGLPQHFRETEAREHLSRLATQFANEHNPSPLSYGAAYHPWLQCRSDSGAIVTMPPDGAALGVLAVRATDRGAWVAPANHRFNTVVALTSPFLSEADVPLNDIRNQPNGFMALRADTLDTDDPALRLISVRRLLILVRRLALRHGAIYAFEPNSDQLRGLVQHRFEQLLRGLYDRGAFSGQGPAQAYQVTADAALNTRLSVDQGRLLVELRVRPSLPMEFITVRLLQRGTGLSVSEGR